MIPPKLIFREASLPIDNSEQQETAAQLDEFVIADQGRNVEGYVEAFAEHEARGWAWCSDAPGEHLEIIARIGDEEIGRALANQFRPDLARSGKGGGDHEFRIVFARWLPPVALTELGFIARIGKDEWQLLILPGSNYSLADKASDAALPIVDEASEPVFILGPARSGTSALALALLHSGQYEGHGEGHLLPLAQALLETVDAYYADREGAARLNTRLQATHLAAFQRMVRRGLIQLTRATYPSGRWIDKTPTAEMIRAAPLMLELWPKARFVFCKRRVLEVIASRRRKFPHDTLQNHYLDWVDSMNSWLSVRERLADHFIEIEQLEMARDSISTSVRLSDFLNFADPAKFCHALATERPEQTGHAPNMVVTMDSLALSDDDLRELRGACDQVMKAFGYSYDFPP